MMRWGIAWGLVFTLATAAEAAQARIADLTVMLDGRTISVSASLIRAFDATIEEEIRHGIPKDLYYYVLLKRRHPIWFDEEVASTTIHYAVAHDLLKDHYTVVRREGTQVTEQTVDQLEDAKRLISHVSDVTIGSADLLDSAATYYISVKAEMRATSVPGYIKYFLFFIPFLDLATPWANTAPFYAEQTVVAP